MTVNNEIFNNEINSTGFYELTGRLIAFLIVNLKASTTDVYNLQLVISQFHLTSSILRFNTSRGASLQI